MYTILWINFVVFRASISNREKHRTWLDNEIYILCNTSRIIDEKTCWHPNESSPEWIKIRTRSTVMTLSLSSAHLVRTRHFFPAGSSFDFVNLATCCETRREQGECTREIASGTPMDWTCHTIDLPVGSPGTLFICVESTSANEILRSGIPFVTFRVSFRQLGAMSVDFHHWKSSAIGTSYREFCQNE